MLCLRLELFCGVHAVSGVTNVGIELSLLQVVP
jgi:hypothetical protein